MVPCPEQGLGVAYSGANVPYPLHGPRLKNRVLYISTSGRVMPKDHEIFQDDWGANIKFMTPEPEITRLLHCPRKWAEALIASRADVLFVMKLPRNVLINTAHDEDFWPVEDSWARSCPKVFSLGYEDKFTRVYFVNQEAAKAIKSLPDGCETRPLDAVTARWDAGQSNRYFPGAQQAMQAMGIRRKGGFFALCTVPKKGVN